MHSDENLITHLESLRRMLWACLVATALCYPLAFWLTPLAISALTQWCLPTSVGKLHYFKPLEVLWVELKLALILALTLAYPWNIWQVWRFLLPALYANERRVLRGWIVGASALFFGGIVFAGGLILPLLMRFSGDFATAELQPIIGLENFVELASWLLLAFGLMFQTPTVVFLAVRLGIISVDWLRQKRPYFIIAILIFSAMLTPPDVLSQLLLALPTWILWEIGVAAAARWAKPL